MSMYCDTTTQFVGVGINILVLRVSKYILPTGSKDLIQDIRMHGSSKSIVVGTSGVEKKAKGNGDQ